GRAAPPDIHRAHRGAGRAGPPVPLRAAGPGTGLAVRLGWAASGRQEPAPAPCPRPGRGTRTGRPAGPAPAEEAPPQVAGAAELPGRRACPGAPARPAWAG